MFRIFLILFAMMYAFSLSASESERIILSEDGVKTLDLPFIMRSYKPSSQGVIRIENFSERQLRLTAIKPGECEIEVVGDGITKTYSVSVVNNLRQLYMRLQSDLEDIPELDISINQDYIVIRGEVSSIKNWEFLLKVLDVYQGKCRNFAIFRPAPEMILNLKKLITADGYEIVDTAAQKSGQISIQLNQGIIKIEGKVYHPKDITAIKNIISTQNWMTEEKETQGKIRSIVNLSVEPVMIDVGVVYVAVSEKEAQAMGNPSANGTIGMFDFKTLYSTLTGGSNTANIGASLNGTIQFLAEAGVSRFETAGHLTFLSNEEKEAKFHHGGTMKVRVQGIQSGDLKDIPYGLEMKVSGGLIGEGKTKLNIEINRNDPPLAQGNDYSQKQSQVTTSVVCPLNQTIVLGGLKEIAEATTEPSGIPYLRNCPVLKWFAAKEGEDLSQLRMLILVSPRIQSPDGRISIPPSKQTQGTYDDAHRSNADRIQEEKSSKGAKSWLDWFSF